MLNLELDANGLRLFSHCFLHCFLSVSNSYISRHKIYFQARYTAKSSSSILLLVLLVLTSDAGVSVATIHRTVLDINHDAKSLLDASKGDGLTTFYQFGEVWCHHSPYSMMLLLLSCSHLLPIEFVFTRLLGHHAGE